MDMEGGAVPSVIKPVLVKKRKYVYYLIIIVSIFYVTNRIGATAWYKEWFSTPSLQHPIPNLLRTGKVQHSKMVNSRSRNLREAYEKYVELHGRLPPKGFDTWFFSSQQTKVCNLDNFNGLYSSLKPFWAITPKELKQKMNSLSSAANIGRVKVREGKVVKFKNMRSEERGSDSDARRAVEEMLEMVVGRFRIKLPDSQLFQLFRFLSFY